MTPLDRLFHPRSVALVGASSDPASPAGITAANLARFRGRFYPVNPRDSELYGLPCFPSLRALPEMVDLSVIMRPAAEVPASVREHRGKARFILVVSAGFAETGNRELQEELAAAGRESGVRLLGPNCLGVFTPSCRLDTSFLPPGGFRRPSRGGTAVVSQSGAILVSILDRLARMHIGVSQGINYGNAVDIDAAEVYDHLAGDETTSLVVSYLESVGDGRRFLAAARRLAAAKPLLILKGGKGGYGGAAALSHTGRLAGSYEVFGSLLRMAGIREIEDFDGLLDATHALSRQRPAAGKRICIVTNAGGAGVLAADEALRLGLELPPLPDAVSASLHGSFPAFYTVATPTDLTGLVRDDDYRLALDTVANDYDAFLVIALTGVAGITRHLASVLTAFREATGKPLVTHVTQGKGAGKLAPLLEARGIPVYSSPERAVRGLRALLGVTR